MKESVALAKEANTKKDFSSTRSDKSIHRVRNEPEKQLGSLRSVIGNIRHDGGTPSLDSIATELSSMHTVQRASVLLALQRTHGNRYVQWVVAGIQAKLKVGQPGDVYEQEADRVAEQVMRMPEPQVQRQLEEEEKKEEEEEEEKTIQPRHSSDQITPLVQRPVEEEEEEELLQPKREINAEHTIQRREEEEEEEEILKTKESPGQTRVHSNPEAAQMARALNAKAFTTGRDVVFGAGQYAPFTNSGRRLLAHELVHVVQQSHKYCRESNKHVVNSSPLATSMIQRQLIEGLEQRGSLNIIIEWSDDFSELLDRVVTALSEKPAFAELAKAHLWQPFSEALHRYLDSCGAHCAALEEGKKMRFNAVAWYDRDADLITYAILRTTTVGLGGPSVKVPEEKLPTLVPISEEKEPLLPPWSLELCAKWKKEEAAKEYYGIGKEELDKKFSWCVDVVKKWETYYGKWDGPNDRLQKFFHDECKVGFATPELKEKEYWKEDLWELFHRIRDASKVSKGAPGVF
jgi:outer membrane biosynthesis protein TonB